MKFKNEYSLYQRKNETIMILNKYPNRVPVICEKSENISNNDPELDKKKYLVPNDLTIGQFVYVIRKRLKITAEKALYLFINGMIPPTSAYVHDIYYYAKDEDGFLYITYTFENTFG